MSSPTAKALFWKVQFVVGWVNGTKFAVVEMIFKADTESLNNFLQSP
jgi:UDP-glucose 6-dehydrogenase